MATVPASATASGVMQAGPSPVTATIVEANLQGKALVAWKSLTKAKKSLTVKILSERFFGVPSQAARLQSKYSELKVNNDRSAGPVTLAASMTRTSWVRQNWTIFGITYTEIMTTMGYTTSGSTVTGVNRCYGTYVNYVPLRSISSNSWYTLGNGLADCWTEWTLGRPLQSTVTGIQGLRVNGYGQILRIWSV